MNTVHPPLPGGYVIYCDDIRGELGGKTSLMGTYGGEMTIFGTAPVRLAKFGALIIFRLDPNDLPESMQIRLVRLRGNDEPEVFFEVSAELPEGAKQLVLPESRPDSRPMLEMRVVHMFDGLEFDGPCTLSTRVIIGDNEFRLGSIDVKIAPREEAPHGLLGAPPQPPQNS